MNWRRWAAAACYGPMGWCAGHDNSVVAVALDLAVVLVMTQVTIDLKYELIRRAILKHGTVVFGVHP